MIEDYDIYRALNSLNPWWSGPWESGFPIKRVAFHEVVKWFNMEGFKRAIVISGARRVGKTVILHQLVEQLISEGWNGEEILYLTLDHPLLKLGGIDRALDVYRQNVRPEPKRIALLLDEVQYVKDWATWIKHAVDFRPELKIVATGSAAMELQTGAEESGVGRWVTVRVPTLSFYEYLILKELEVPDAISDLDISKILESDRSELKQLVRRLHHLQDHFHNYILQGGFPELVRIEHLDDAQRLLREDVVDKVLKRDMTVSFGVRQVQELENLFLYLCINSGGILSKRKVASELGVSLPTIDKFINYLEAAHLIFRLYPFEQTGKKLLKRKAKIYISDAGLRNAVLLKGREMLESPEEMGLCVETAVIRNTITTYYNNVIGYWKDNVTKKEVDLIIRNPRGVIPIEVKYRSAVSSESIAGLALFCEKSAARLAILVSKQLETLGKGILHGAPNTNLITIPAYILLFLGGGSDIRAAGKILMTD